MSDAPIPTRPDDDQFVDVTDAVGQPLGWLDTTRPLHPARNAKAAPSTFVGGERWRAQAACQGLPTALFFSDDVTDEIRAKQVCAHCPACGPCLEYALAHAPYGIWGGLSADERHRLQRRRRRTGRLA